MYRIIVTAALAMLLGTAPARACNFGGCESCGLGAQSFGFGGFGGFGGFQSFGGFGAQSFGGYGLGVQSFAAPVFVPAGHLQFRARVRTFAPPVRFRARVRIRGRLGGSAFPGCFP